MGAGVRLSDGTGCFLLFQLLVAPGRIRG
jgi:hypothetical protein